MNKLFTKIAALALGAAMAFGVGVAVGSKSEIKPTFADSKGITFSAAVGGNNVDKTSSGITWHISSDGSESTFDSTKGIHYGTNSGQVTYIRISTSGIDGTISQVVVNASAASGVSATVGVTVGNVQFGGDPKSISSSATNYTFTGSASGALLVEITKPSKATKAIYCKSVDVTYTTGGGGGDTPATEGFVINKDTLDAVGSGTGYTKYNGNHELDGISYTSYQVMPQSGNVQFQKNTSYLFNTTSFGKITKITLASGSNLNIRVHTSAFTGRQTSTGTAVFSGSTVSGTNGYFLIYDTGSTGTCTSITVESEAATYTVSFGVNTAGYGTVSQASITGVASGTSITSSSNTVTVGTTTVTATPAASTAQYTYTFNGWTGASGTVTADKTITANFTRTTNKYTVYWKNWDNSTLETDTNVDYGTTPTYNSATPTKAATAEYNYTFTGWSPSVGPITGNTTYIAQFSQAKNTFTVTDNVTDGSVYDLGSDSVLSPIEYGNDLMVNIVPDSGCDYPAEVIVTMGGNDITEDIIYDPTDGSVMYEGITGNISITAECPISGSMHSIDVNCTNCTYSGPDEMGDEQEVQITITPSSGYKLPSAAVVGVNTYISVSNAVEWSYSAGVITILGAAEAGDVGVDVTCPALESYSITVNSGSATYSGPSTIQENGEAVIVFTHSQGCAHPADVTVSNNVTKSWNQANGTLTLSNPSGAVEVTYVEVTNQLDTITLNPSSGTYTLGQTFTVKPTVTANYTVAASADVTASATESVPEGKMDGNMFVKTGEYNITYSYTEGGITRTADYHVTVNAFEPVPATVSWVATDLANLTSSDEFVIARTSGTTVALPSNGGASRPSATSVTISNDTITSTVTDSLVWKVSGNASDGYVFSPKGDSSSWLYLLDDANDGVRIGTTTENKHFTLNQGYLYTEDTTYPRMVGVYNNGDWRCYKLTDQGEPHTNIASQTFGFFKKTTSGGTPASIIRITASYTGAQKFVGETVSESDFTVYKQMNDSDELISVTSGYTLSSTTLTSTSTNITVSYEGKSFVVAVPATERTAELQSITLVQGQGVVKNYIDWSGAAWNYAGLSVAYDWDDDTYDEEISLSDLIESGADVTISPAKPSVGTTSFSVSYTYEGKSLQSNTVSGITVVEDYVTSISWTGTSAAQFKAFSGSQLTAAQVGAWHVTPTFAGSGQGNELSFADYTLKVGSKVISSLPYTWSSEDDGQELSITYGKDVDGNDFVKKNDTAVGNICATINAIDHEETISGEQTLDNFIDTTSETWNVVEEGTSGTGSETKITNAGFTVESDKGYWTGSQYRSYKESNLTISSSYTIKSITFTFSGSYNGNLSTDPYTVNATSKEFSDLGSQARITSIQIVFEGSVTTTVHYANDMNHFDAQKKVVEFAKFMNTTMNGSNVCSGTFANLESAWDDVADKYDELFGASTTLNETELAWAKNMLKYANAIWGSDAEAACVEKAMKTYEHCVAKYELEAFMVELRSVSKTSIINPIIDVNNNAPILVTVIVSMIGLSAVGGYFFLRKRKENI